MFLFITSELRLTIMNLTIPSPIPLAALQLRGLGSAASAAETAAVAAARKDSSDVAATFAIIILGELTAPPPSVSEHERQRRRKKLKSELDDGGEVGGVVGVRNKSGDRVAFRRLPAPSSRRSSRITLERIVGIFFLHINIKSSPIRWSVGLAGCLSTVEVCEANNLEGLNLNRSVF